MNLNLILILKFTDDILQCLDNNKIAIVTFMDLSKAFDRVNHDILLTKRGDRVLTSMHYNG